MTLQGEHVLLRIYLQRADRTPLAPTYERIVKAAHSEKMAGATVLQGIAGFGYHGPIRATTFSIALYVPVIVEIVDTAEKIFAFISGPLEKIMIGGMLTLERAAVVMHRRQRGDSSQKLQLGPSLKPLSTIPELQPGPHMTSNESGILVRVFIGESDRFESQPLYEAIIQKAREIGVAGATVLRGTEGFGANSVVHKASMMEMSSDLPVVIEIVDSRQKIDLLLPHLEAMVSEGMITMEEVMVLIYRHNENKSN
jgi:PII-like signaling protein